MSTSDLASLAIILGTMFVTAVFTALTRKLLLQRAVLDIPNDRSSHTTPTPRGGGWAIVATLIPGLIVASLCEGVHHYSLLSGLILLVVISWFDDRKHVAPALRLTLHILAAYLGSRELSPAHMLFAGWLPLWLDRAMTVVGWAWFMNLYNFMDGIDGITGVETLALATGSSLLMTVSAIFAPFAESLTLLLTGSSLGFLIFNWAPARLFMGDVGSVPLGYLTGYLLILLATHNLLLPALILPLYYLADSGITIAKRALRREKIWQAHRQHFYQTAAVREGSHAKVAIWIALTDSGLIASALAATRYAVAGASAALLLVGFLLARMSRQKPNP